MEDGVSGGWVRFENTTPDNLKVAPLTDRAHRLWFNAICYCSRARSSGRVPAALILTLSPTANPKAIAELLEAGLVERLDDKTYVVHDYLDYNPSRERIEEMREGNRERVARHRGKRDGNALRDASSNALQDRNPHVRDRSVPVPEELEPHLERVLGVLGTLAERHGAKAVNRDSVANVIAARPRKPLVRAAHDCAAWWDASSRRLKDVVSAYRNWLDKTEDLATVEQLSAGARVVPLQRSAALQRADSWESGYEDAS